MQKTRTEGNFVVWYTILVDSPNHDAVYGFGKYKTFGGAYRMAKSSAVNLIFGCKDWAVVRVSGSPDLIKGSRFFLTKQWGHILAQSKGYHHNHFWRKRNEADWNT